MGGKASRRSPQSHDPSVKILLTGATSFTGFWFASTLRDAGHEVVCLLTRNDSRDYQGKEVKRFNVLTSDFQLVFKAPFGSKQFVACIRETKPQLLCVHGAHIPAYRSADFNIAESLQANLRNIAEVSAALAENRVPILLTGTVFEAGEGGAGNVSVPGSPYGLAKGLITQAFRYYAGNMGLKLGHFVIPNPFGPLEDQKFNHYLATTWLNGAPAEVRTPLYVRDNIPVDLLALAYAKACASMPSQTEEYQSFQPSGYQQTQGEFTFRMAREFSTRLQIECRVSLCDQIEFSEPKSRVNSWNAFAEFGKYSEQEFWDKYVGYYRQLRQNSL